MHDHGKIIINKEESGWEDRFASICVSFYNMGIKFVAYEWVESAGPANKNYEAIIIKLQ